MKTQEQKDLEDATLKKTLAFVDVLEDFGNDFIGKIIKESFLNGNMEVLIPSLYKGFDTDLQAAQSSIQKSVDENKITQQDIELLKKFIIHLSKTDILIEFYPIFEKLVTIIAVVIASIRSGNQIKNEVIYQFVHTIKQNETNRN